MIQKPQVLIITAHRANRAPSQRFRYEQYTAFLSEHGFHIETSYLISEKDDKIFYSPGQYLGKIWILLKSIFIRIKDVFRSNSFDIIFIHREAFMLGTSFFERMFARSKAKVIFDFDDSIWLQQPTDSSANRKLFWLKRPSKTSESIKVADLVFAGNQYLADYALQFNKNVEIIPTTVDTEEYSLRTSLMNDSPICIGWSGSPTTIDHFDFAVPALIRIKEKYGDKVKFKVIGDKHYKNEMLGIQGMAWTRESEIAELKKFDIGIMPLPDQEWTKGKCGLKGLLYMSVGIPAIMSAVGVNKDIIHHGTNGFLASTEEEWVEILSKLIEEPALRERTGKEGRKTVELHYSVLSQREKYLYYFNQLIRH